MVSYCDNIISVFFLKFFLMQEHIWSNEYRGRIFQVVKRSEQVWKECVEVVKFLFPPA